MRKLWLVLLIALAVVACAPAFEPAPGEAPGVSLTAEPAEGYVTYRLEAEPAVRRVVLRFVGTNLTTTEEDCTLVNGALECVVNEPSGLTELELHVSGTVQNHPELPYGVVCRTECHAIWLGG